LFFESDQLATKAVVLRIAEFGGVVLKVKTVVTTNFRGQFPCTCAL
jgi:hypothetical protein